MPDLTANDSGGGSVPVGPAEPVATLLRWELAGGVWRVLEQRKRQVTIGLFSCDAGEEMDRFTSSDERLLAVVEERESRDT